MKWRDLSNTRTLGMEMMVLTNFQVGALSDRTLICDHTAYTNSCVQANRAPITKQMFGRLIKKYRPKLR